MMTNSKRNDLVVSMLLLSAVFVLLAMFFCAIVAGMLCGAWVGYAVAGIEFLVISIASLLIARWAIRLGKSEERDDG